MFTLRRLSRLGARQRLAKAVRILQAAEGEIGRGRPVDSGYLHGLADLVAAWTPGPAAEAARILAAAAAAATAVPANGSDSRDPAHDLLRATNGLRHALLAALGAEPSEWDLVGPDGELDRSSVRIRPMAVYLEDLRSPYNV